MTPRRALLVFLALGLFHLWPLSAAPWRLSLNYNADAEYNAWAVAWIVRTLPANPAGLFDANIFSPEPATLAYSHPILVPALAAAPVLAAGGSPVFAFNVSLFVGLVLTAWSMWFVVRSWSGSEGAALVSGALAAFNVHLLTRLPHLTAAHAWGLPLAIYFADRLMRRGDRRDAAGLAAVIALIAATSFYWLALAWIAIAITVVAHRLRPVPSLRTTAAALAGLVLASPMLVPYLRLAGDGLRRPIDMVADFSATPAGYLATTSRLHGDWSAPFFRDDVDLFFAGFTALALAGVGVAAGWTSARRRVVLLALLAAVGVWLSLGPATALYRVAYDWFLPLQGLRAAARFGFLYLTAVAVAAGLGVAWLEGRMRSPRLGAAVVALALVLVTAEVWQGPVRTQPFEGVPPIYALLTESDTPVSVVEVPFWPPDAVHFNGEYVLNSTAHWQPLMNGTSGVTPDSYRRRTQAFWFFPRDHAIDAMHDDGATHLMVHLEKFDEGERRDIAESLAHRPDVWLIAADGYGHRLYELRGADDAEDVLADAAVLK
jgi:hypothetical protein